MIYMTTIFENDSVSLLHVLGLAYYTRLILYIVWYTNVYLECK